MAKSKLVKANQKIAESVVSGYHKIEEGVVSGYQKIEDGVVSGFTRITDKFVDEFLTKEGESVEDAKRRLAAEQAKRQAGRYALSTVAPPDFQLLYLDHKHHRSNKNYRKRYVACDEWYTRSRSGRQRASGTLPAPSPFPRRRAAGEA